MKIKVLVVGKLKDRYLETGIQDYLKRIKRFCQIELIRVKEVRKTTPSTEPKALIKEAERLVSQTKPEDTLIVLSEEGVRLSSRQWSVNMQRFLEHTRGELVFVIGSSCGLAPEIKKKATKVISLSTLTFPHQLALILLLEQIYRGWSIMKGFPYHR